MNRSILSSFVLSAALLLGCNSSGTSSQMYTDPLCGRLHDIDARCTPSRGACLLQADYDTCVAYNPLYRPEYTTAYLACYPDNIGCDPASGGNASNCMFNAADKVAVSTALSMLANDLCQRCPGYAGDGVTDMTTCVMYTTTDQTPEAQLLRWFTDDTLTKLDVCLRNSSPPADGCIAYKSCKSNVYPIVSTKPCTDGGA